MKDTERRTQSETEKTYVKPTASIVKLRMSEMVLGSCKNEASGGPADPNTCSPLIGACSALGS